MVVGLRLFFAAGAVVRSCEQRLARLCAFCAAQASSWVLPRLVDWVPAEQRGGSVHIGRVGRLCVCL